jgi:hypothetical protein
MDCRWCPISGIHYTDQDNKTPTAPWNDPGDQVGMR